MTNHTDNVEDKVVIRSSKMVTEQVESAGIEIHLDESGYGSGQHQVVVLSAAKKKTLQKFIAERKYRRTHEGDRPGQVFATGLKCLGYVKGDFNRWQAICISSTYWDV